MLPDHFYCLILSKFLLVSLSMLNVVFYSSCLNYLIFEVFLFLHAACVLAASQWSYMVHLCCIVLLTVTSSIYLELYMREFFEAWLELKFSRNWSICAYCLSEGMTPWTLLKWNSLKDFLDYMNNVNLDWNLRFSFLYIWCQRLGWYILSPSFSV